MTMLETIPEGKKNHLWRCTIWQTDPELHPLGPHHSVSVYCCEEANGYAVWYVRRLPHANQNTVPGVENGDYLLSYFGRNRRDDAITFAVHASTSSASSELQIAALDERAKHVQKI
ncbi:MAG: hypothetical protein V4695_03220 [Pseudomonadota bacterium]